MFLGACNELKWESRENREWARRCIRVRKSYKVTVAFGAGWEGTMSRMIRKSEDQPKKIMVLLHGLKSTKMTARINLGNPVSIYCNRSGFFFAWFHNIDRMNINLQKNTSNQENVK